MALGWLWWRAGFPRAAVVAAAFCVAGVALGEVLATCSCTLRGRRGTLRHPPSFHVAGVVLGRTTCEQFHHTTCSWRHVAALCVAGVALGDM